MMNKREFKKYRKNALKEIHYQNVYEDGVIEVKQGYFTKMYMCFGDILNLFDLVHRLHNTTDGKFVEFGLNAINAQITYYNKSLYFTVGLTRNSYEECQEAFSVLENYAPELRPLAFRERMMMLYCLYQNDDNFENRYNTFACRKGETLPPSNFAECMKNFKKNKKNSKDLMLPYEMVENPTEFEFEGNYIRFFYLKNTPRYLTKEFFEDLKYVENLCFSIHLKPLNQTQIINYVETKFEVLKDLKKSEINQKQFFEAALPELKKSARRNEEMFLITMVLGVSNESINDLNKKMKKLVREFESSYVVKELKFQQKNALNTFLPFCEDSLDVKTTIYKMAEKK